MILNNTNRLKNIIYLAELSHRTPSDIVGIPQNECWLWYIFNCVAFMANSKNQEFASVRELING